MTAVADITSPADLGSERLQAWRRQLDCRFAEIDDVFEASMAEAHARLSAEGVDEFLTQARFLGKMGRGVEPALTFLQAWPFVAQQDRKSTRLNSSHVRISYAVFCRIGRASCRERV